MTTKQFQAALLAASLVGFSAEVMAQPPPRKLELAHIFDLEQVASPRVSPAGPDVVYTRTWVDKVNDRQRSELWIMSQGGDRPRKLCEGSDAEWCPDGKRLAYLAPGEPRGKQVHVVWVESRETTQITHVDEEPASLRWSPDGKQIAFVMNVPEKEQFKIKLPDRPKDAKWAPEPTVITRLVYRRDGVGYRPAGFRHLFVVDADGGTARQVTSGDYDHGRPEWSRDGERLYFGGLRKDDADWQWRESEIYSVEIESGAVKQLTDRKGPDQDPVVSPDGKHIAFLGQDFTRDTYGVLHAYVMDADGSGVKDITKEFDRDPIELRWRRDSKGVYFSADGEGATHVWYASTDGAVSRVTSGGFQLRLADVGKHGALLGVLKDATTPGDVVYFLPDHAEKITRLTHVNQDVLAHVKLGDVEELRWKSADDLEIQGWLVKPPDFDPARKWPLMLQIHGGPHAMYGIGFDSERQVQAAAGYVVLYCNPRGSTGYGKDFGNAIDHAYPGRDYDDLMGGVDAAVAKGFVDPERLFVYGGSGGGVLTAWIVGHTHRFKAAVSMFPVIDWVSFVGTTDGIHWYNNFRTLPWEDVSEHWERSPLKYVGNVKTPTMLITGEMDLRTPMSQSEEFFQALKYLKVDTALVRVADEYHGAAGRHVSNTLRRILYVREWFRRHDPAVPKKEPAEAGDEGR